MTSFTVYVKKGYSEEIYEEIHITANGGSAEYKIRDNVYSDLECTKKVGIMAVQKEVIMYGQEDDSNYGTGAIYFYYIEFNKKDSDILSFTQNLGEKGITVDGKPAFSELAGTYKCGINGSSSAGYFLNASGVVTKTKDSSNIRTYAVKIN